MNLQLILKPVLKNLPFAMFLLGGAALYGLAHFKHKSTKKLISDCLKVDDTDDADDMSWLGDLDADYEYQEFEPPTKQLKSYNPFDYIRSEDDVWEFVSELLYNTQGDNDSVYAFTKIEDYLLEALVGYLYFEGPRDEQNLTTVVEMLDAMKSHESDKNLKNAVDFLFETLGEHSPEHYAVQQYALYKLFTSESAELTENTIINSCKKRIKNLMLTDVVAICDKLNSKCEGKGREAQTWK